MKNKNITWADLKAFCNALSNEQLETELCVDQGETSERVMADLTATNIYIGEDAEDVYDEEGMQEAIKEGEAKIEDYRLQPKGTPFLTTEF